MIQKVPRIMYQSRRALMFKVPSKSEPGTTHITEFRPNGSRHCRCPGVGWFKKKGQDLVKYCRHQKMTTIFKSTDDPWEELQQAMKTVKDKEKMLAVALNHVKCQSPENYDEEAVHCKGCELYPVTCNIHKIKINHRGKLPLVWKLQYYVYHGRRQAATKVLMKIMKNVRRMRKSKSEEQN